MSKTKQPANIPEIQAIPLKDFTVDLALSGRSQKEVTTNAKALAPAMKAAEGWDATQPGAFFIRDGKKHLARGFTRLAAAEIAELKTGFFVEIQDEPTKLRTEAIRSNMGKPISRYEQGRIYAQMRDGSDPEKLAVGEVAMPAMTQKEIAEDVGYTQAHVSQCIAIFESPEDIRPLVENDEIAEGLVYEAAKLAKKGDEVDEGKQLRILKACIAEAKRDGKDKATKKHFDAIKHEFAPKLKAATPPKAEKPSKQDEGDDDAGSEENDAGEPASDAQPPSGELGLSSPAPTPKPVTKKDRDSQVRQLSILLQSADENLPSSNTLTQEDADLMAEWLLDNGVAIVSTPL